MNVYKKLLLNLGKQYFHRHAPIFKEKNFKLKTLVATSSGISIGSAFVLMDVNEGTASSYIWATIRFLRSLKIGLIISFDYYFSTMGLNENLGNYKPMMSLIHQRAAVRIRDGCLMNGGTYIKLGQGLVSLSHILPVEYVDVLSSLQDHCLFHDPSEMLQIIEEDFGKKPWDLFNCINPKPIAAASLSQVFKGETIEGDTVAIKVQYIDLQSRFVSDVATINFLLDLIGFIHPDFNFNWVLTDLSASLKEELDFLQEARNAERCAKDLKDFKSIYVPKVYWNYCSSRFLVTEFIDAFKINDVDRIKREGLSISDIDLKVCTAFGHQIFTTGFVHADPHPGNLLVRKRNNTAEIVLLDHGLYQELDPCTCLALSGMWKAIVLHNDENMQKYAKKLGVQNYEILAEILTQRPIRTKGFKLTTRITEEQMQYMTEAAQHRFEEIMQVLKIMPRSLLLVVRNLNTIRSITYDHGDPIDRYTILARCANKDHTCCSVVYVLKTLPGKLYFEMKLLTGRIWVWYIKTYLKILKALGRSPDTSTLVADLS